MVYAGRSLVVIVAATAVDLLALQHVASCQPLESATHVYGTHVIFRFLLFSSCLVSCGLLDVGLNARI